MTSNPADHVSGSARLRQARQAMDNKRAAAARRNSKQNEDSGTENPQMSALENLQSLLPADEDGLIDQCSRLALERDSKTQAMRKAHAFRTRVVQLRRAWEEDDDSAYDRPPTHWKEDDEGNITEVIKQGDMIFTKDHEVGLVIPYGELGRIMKNVEQGVEAAQVLLRYRLMVMDGAIKMEDIERYMDEVVLHDRDDIPAGQRAAAILTEIKKMFVVGEDQEADAMLADEMGDALVIDQADYLFTFRLRTIDNPIVVERLNGICNMALLRETQEQQERLAADYGEDSPVYQALAAFYKAVGLADIF